MFLCCHAHFWYSIIISEPSYFNLTRAGDDYIFISEATVNLTRDSSTATFLVQIIDDAQPEYSTESLAVFLQIDHNAPSYVTLSHSALYLEIQDNDGGKLHTPIQASTQCEGSLFNFHKPIIYMEVSILGIIL